MIEFALGLVETKGLIGAIEAADAMLKTSNVRLIGKERTDPAMITIKIIGETAAVRSAVEAGAAAAQKVGQLISKHVIPRPAEGMEDLIFAKSFLDEHEISTLITAGVHSTPEIQEIEENVEYVEPQSTERNAFFEELNAMTVHQLRSYARTMEGLAIHGREISRANKEQLLDELIRARFG
jgi:microcompartment protein CcmL/EutN